MLVDLQLRVHDILQIFSLQIWAELYYCNNFSFILFIKPQKKRYGKNQTMAYPNCMFDVEEERFFGIEHKNASMLWYRQQNFNNGCKETASCPDCPKGCYPYDIVSANQSTVARMAAALSSLATTNTTGDWGDFLRKTPDLYGNLVTWNNTIIAGQ